MPPPVKPTKNVINWGHRGASGHATENTLLAFQMAMTMGADGIECDLRETRDGQIVIFHDATLKRIAGQSEAIDQCSLAQLKKIDLGSGERIPTLSELIETVRPPFLLNLEIKAARPETILEILYREGAQDRVLLSSFDPEPLLQARSLDSTIRIGYLVGQKMRVAIIKQARQMNANTLHLGRRQVTKAVLDRAHREGFLVYAYTVNLPSQMVRFIEMGVDGLFTNYPDRLSKIRTGISATVSRT